ncbi:hypothetical protein DPMN_127227 [Dreissena polymorpha]|uniref:Uncharacterized protein n=1 Tax=Dreissena polymorpha TaxID=45954 RepID=A0A9D4JYM9_DREPO|nr:hypothetical protein DPMN_127227 [Dreissena polymorpha]
MKATLLCAFFAFFLVTSCVLGTPKGRGMGGFMGGKEMMYEFDGKMGDDGMMYDDDAMRTGGKMGKDWMCIKYCIVARFYFVCCGWRD